MHASDSVGAVRMDLYINDQFVELSMDFDFKDRRFDNVNSIKIRSITGNQGLDAYIYYFEVREITDFILFEGTSDETGDLEFDDNIETTFSSTPGYGPYKDTSCDR